MRLNELLRLHLRLWLLWNVETIAGITRMTWVLWRMCTRVMIDGGVGGMEIWVRIAIWVIAGSVATAIVSDMGCLAIDLGVELGPGLRLELGPELRVKLGWLAEIGAGRVKTRLPGVAGRSAVLCTFVYILKVVS